MKTAGPSFGRRVRVRCPGCGNVVEVIMLNYTLIDERHLKRRLSEYIRYYREDRTHLGLGKGTPDGRTRTVAAGHVLSHPRLGGLHHRYDRAA